MWIESGIYNNTYDRSEAAYFQAFVLWRHLLREMVLGPHEDVLMRDGKRGPLGTIVYEFTITNHHVELVETDSRMLVLAREVVNHIPGDNAWVADLPSDVDVNLLRKWLPDELAAVVEHDAIYLKPSPVSFLRRLRATKDLMRRLFEGQETSYADANPGMLQTNGLF